MCSEAPLVSVLGVGPYQTPMVTAGITLGINVRNGMEDNVVYRKGELRKDNPQLVERVVGMARYFGREIATPKQARQMLVLSEKTVNIDGVHRREARASCSGKQMMNHRTKDLSLAIPKDT